VDRLVAAYPTTDFAGLLELRQPSFATNDLALRALYLDYRARMLERGGAFYAMVRGRQREFYEAATGEVALVVGCGAGASMLALAPDFDLVVGIDPCLDDLILAKKAAEERGIMNLVLIQGYAQRLPLGDASVDFVIAEDVIEHLFDLDAAFAEIGRVMAAGALFGGNSVNRYNLLRPEPHVRLSLIHI
jgi:ubiquinone/menaquinone biosynthesis C-methylase UbiE